MSRRPPNPGAERASQNQQTLKTLVKVESNKTCADCKRNKHPRWASWNLGVFLCIRCSGIHRGMGTHISRVKSVDLDAWTDEQMQSILRWGNARANRYWEAKLAPGHVPAEAKIENFIRTKYDSKRWVMDGGMPDPATLGGDGDDEVPLNVVQEKAKIERSASQRSSSIQPPPPAPRPQDPGINLFGDDPVSSTTPAPRASSAASAPTAAPQPPAQTSSTQRSSKAGGDSLLGFDFFGSSQSNPPSRPSSAAASASNANVSRPDLKQSILSLYSTAPKPQPPAQQQQSSPSSAQNPETLHGRSLSQSTSPNKGLEDAFGSLNFSTKPAQSPPAAPPNQSAISNLPSPIMASASPASQFSHSKQPSTGGSFFDAKPATKSPSASVGMPDIPSSRPQQRLSSSDGFGDFASSETKKASDTKPAAKSQDSTKSASNDLADFGAFSAPPATQAKPPSQSPFNLSAPSPQAQSRAQPQPQPQSHAALSKGTGVNTSGIGNMDPWGSSDVWASSKDTTSKAPPTKASATTATDLGGWNTGPSITASTSTPAAPKVTADEDFGGWETNASAGTSTSQAGIPKAGGFGGSDDLFSNVWE
ncbi:MAG: hypothetical protein M1831_003675 [Alyxoria varia]|nr:MAG: hypothetical protein M1831_003675 [Alyxoria varia]